MRKFPQLGVNVRRAIGFTTIAFLLAATTNTAQPVAFEPSDEGQLFGLQREVHTAGMPGGATFVDGTLYVADSDNGTVVAFAADGSEAILLADEDGDPLAGDASSPLFGLVPNMLSSVSVRILRDSAFVDTTALLVSDWSGNRVIAVSLEAGREGDYLFTMRLDWPDGQEDHVNAIAVVNGTATAQDARFVFTPATGPPPRR